jgi:thiamine pyrophosphate-dependent acetolactate synthase large subunit-like protein
MSHPLSKLEKSDLILESFSSLNIENLFTFPSKKIDPVLEGICAKSAIELTVCTSELAVLDSAIAYSAMSKKISAVIIDPEFMPAEFISILVRAKALALKVLFIFTEPLPVWTLSALESIGQSVERTDGKSLAAHLFEPKPRVWIVDPPSDPNEVTNHEPLQFDTDLATSSVELETESSYSNSSLLTTLIREVLTQSPNSILIPDAGAARKVLITHFPDKISGPLNAAGLYPMGRSLRSVRGVAAAATNRLPVTILGDGSMLIQGTELAWLARARISCLVLLCLNGQLGNRNSDTHVGAASKLPDVDWEKFVVALGARCAPVQSRFDKTTISDCISFAWADHGPVVIPIDITVETDSIYQLITGIPFLDYL